MLLFFLINKKKILFSSLVLSYFFSFKVLTFYVYGLGHAYHFMECVGMEGEVG